MKLSRKANIILSVFVLVAIITISTYVKSTSTLAKNEIQESTTISINKNAKQLEDKHILEKQQKLEEQNKLENEKKLAVLKKLEDQKKLEAQKKLIEQKKQEEIAKQQLIISKNQTSSNDQAKITIATTEPKPKQELLIDKINGKGNSKQAIVVTTNGFGSVNATITTYENTNGNWKQVASFNGNVGKRGFAYNKVEGDGHSPIGIFSLGTAFGRYSNPGTIMNYRQSTSNDFWVDDVNSPLYNTWQKGPVNGRWTSAESMNIPQYNYGFVINYNTTKRIPGKGSAIFFHVWSGPGQGTAGCIATAQNNVTSILRWLNPSKSPIIIEGPMSEVTKM